MRASKFFVFLIFGVTIISIYWLRHNKALVWGCVQFFSPDLCLSISLCIRCVGCVTLSTPVVRRIPLSSPGRGCLPKSAPVDLSPPARFDVVREGHALGSVEGCGKRLFTCSPTSSNISKSVTVIFMKLVQWITHTTRFGLKKKKTIMNMSYESLISGLQAKRIGCSR